MGGATEGAARISAAELRTRLLEREDEIAVLDVRTERRYGDGHLLVASNAPLHHLESDLPQLIPRRATPTVLCSDNGDGLAEQAAGIMKMAGYLHPLVLEGGIAGCKAVDVDDLRRAVDQRGGKFQVAIIGDTEFSFRKVSWPFVKAESDFHIFEEACPINFQGRRPCEFE